MLQKAALEGEGGGLFKKICGVAAAYQLFDGIKKNKFPNYEHTLLMDNGL